MKKEFSGKPKMTQFPNQRRYDQIVILKDIPFQSLCEHHLLAFRGLAHVGYLPDSKIVGISKIARAVEFHLNPIRPTIQENATGDLLDFLVKELKPKGCGVVIEGQHSCCQFRGIKAHNSTMITSAIYGLFHKSDVKDEFLRLVGK
jgi:GTP cyclohydrolase I